MLKKRKIRELAMQILFAWEMAGVDNEAAWQIVEQGTQDAEARASALEMAGGVWGLRAEFDARIERIAPQWPPRRQPIVDRCLIRLAVWELTHRDTPPKVILDEAIELAKEFSTEQSAAFVNGVLDAVLKEHKQLLSAIPSPLQGEGGVAGGTPATPGEGRSTEATETAGAAEASPASPADHGQDARATPPPSYDI